MQVSPGEQSQAVRHGLLSSGRQTRVAQSRQVGQLGTQAQRWPDGQVDDPSSRISQVEIGAGHSSSDGIGLSPAAAAPASPTTAKSSASSERGLSMWSG